MDMSKVFLLEDRSVTLTHLLNFTIVIVSYNFVVAELLSLYKFDRQMIAHENGENIVVPSRPNLTLLSGVWRADFVRNLGRHLILDEVHTIKNTSRITFDAIRILREQFDYCLMLTGRPLDKNSKDIFALASLLRGHPFTSLLRMQEAFTDAYADPRKEHPELCVPHGIWRDRLSHFMNAFVLARSPITMEVTLPPIHRVDVKFDLPRDELEKSNDYYEKFKASKKEGGGEDGINEKKERDWSSFTLASQWAYHPDLVVIMALERKLREKDQSNEDEGKEEVENLTVEETEIWQNWHRKLYKDENSRSARVDYIIEIINYHRESRLDDAIVVMEESIYFLDVLEAALKTIMYDPIPVYRYDGRTPPTERHARLQEFSNGTGIRIMLATRGTCGEGLNLQCANVQIRCGPWWKRSWELQAERWQHRPGQTKPTWIYSLFARNCRVESHKITVANKKNKVSESIMEKVVLKDGEKPPEWEGE